MKMIIGGEFVDSSNGEKLSVLNPATLEKIDEVPAATKEDVERAITCAEKGAAEWGVYPLHQRIQIIRSFLTAYEQHRDELIDMLQKETGKITAAATTGPQRGPLPASSQPQTAV